MEQKKYYALEQDGDTAELTIFGDITSWPWIESDVTSYTLSKELAQIEADKINVYLNSYGGEVAEGLAIYNSLKRHKAKIKTVVDGFACSIASVIFMAGDERVVNEASLLMIHDPWTIEIGNADDMRKAADDMDVVAKALINAYLSGVSIKEPELKELMKAETWIDPDMAVEKGFATSINATEKSEKPAATVRKKIIDRLKEKPKQEKVVKLDGKQLAEMTQTILSGIQRPPLEPEKKPEQSEKNPDPKPEPKPKSYMEQLSERFSGKE